LNSLPHNPYKRNGQDLGNFSMVLKKGIYVEGGVLTTLNMDCYDAWSADNSKIPQLQEKCSASVKCFNFEFL
jgi:hypothetical protein